MNATLRTLAQLSPMTAAYLAALERPRRRQAARTLAALNPERAPALAAALRRVR